MGKEVVGWKIGWGYASLGQSMYFIVYRVLSLANVTFRKRKLSDKLVCRQQNTRDRTTHRTEHALPRPLPSSLSVCLFIFYEHVAHHRNVDRHAH